MIFWNPRFKYQYTRLTVIVSTGMACAHTNRMEYLNLRFTRSRLWQINPCRIPLSWDSGQRKTVWDTATRCGSSRALPPSSGHPPRGETSKPSPTEWTWWITRFPITIPNDRMHLKPGVWKTNRDLLWFSFICSSAKCYVYVIILIQN